MDMDCLTEDAAWEALPDREALVRRAAEAVFATLGRPVPAAELSVVFSSDAAVAELNSAWRGRSGATNVLSFPAAPAGEGPPHVLGDIVLAAGVVRREAEVAGKPLANHVTHLIIHGLLHLLGYGHDDDAEAETMERLEAEAMARLGYPDPYRDAAAPDASTRPAPLDER